MSMRSTFLYNKYLSESSIMSCFPARKVSIRMFVFSTMVFSISSFMNKEKASKGVHAHLAVSLGPEACFKIF